MIRNDQLVGPALLLRGGQILKEQLHAQFPLGAPKDPALIDRHPRRRQAAAGILHRAHAVGEEKGGDEDDADDAAGLALLLPQTALEAAHGLADGHAAVGMPDEDDVFAGVDEVGAGGADEGEVVVGKGGGGAGAVVGHGDAEARDGDGEGGEGGDDGGVVRGGVEEAGHPDYCCSIGSHWGCVGGFIVVCSRRGCAG